MITVLLALLLQAEPRPFDARVEQAQQLRTRGLPGDALDLLAAVEADAKKKKDPVSEGRALQKRGDLRLDVNDCQGAKTSYEAALQSFGKADPFATAQTWNDLGMWAKHCSSPDDQKTFFASALGIYEELREQKGIRKIANNLGTAHFNAGDKATAVGFFKKAAAAAQTLEDDEGLSTAQANIALMELLLAQERLDSECVDFTASQKADRGFHRAVAAFAEAARTAKRMGKPPLWVCAKFGIFSDSCEPCLIKR